MKGKTRDDRIRGEQPAAIREPKCHNYTEVGTLMRSLRWNTDVDRIEALASVSGADQKRIETLRRDLADNPARAATQVRLCMTRVARMISLVQQIAERLSDERTEQLRTDFEETEAKERAARVEATSLFTDEPLPHIGSDVWRALWEAARQYSSLAYPGHKFPVTGEVEGKKAVCVLCQQELGDGGSGRLTRFEKFVQDNAQQARRALEEARSEVSNLQLSAADRRDFEPTLRDELDEPHLATCFRRYFAVARLRRCALLKVKKAQEWPSLRSLPASPEERLQTLPATLADRRQELLEQARSDDSRGLERELHELEDRVWLQDVVEDVKEETDRLALLEGIAACIRQTDTTAISRKCSDVAERLVTQALRDRFEEELRRLALDHLPAELVRETSQYGVPRFRVSLPVQGNVRVGRILSEGEYRCIALAAFLCELETANNRSAIVLDDPVCSLDHQYSEAFAKRLAEEARTRQVIVLTHHLVFVFQLDRAAREQGIQPFFQHICRAGETVGLCETGLPPDSRPVGEAIDAIKVRFSQTRKLYDNGQVIEWQEQAKRMYDMIRNAWEAATADALARVIRRFGRKVDTKNLRLITVFTEDDCKTVDAARFRCSTHLHNQPAAMNDPGPTPDDLEEEIEELDRWVEDIRARQEQVEASGEAAR